MVRQTLTLALMEPVGSWALSTRRGGLHGFPVERGSRQLAFHWDGDSGAWIPGGGAGVSIAVSPSGIPYVVSSGDNICYAVP